jgi:adenylate kinase family enzyme
MTPGQIIFITGTPGSGKTTVAEALCARLEKSAHIPVDFFRKMIKAGYASPHHWSAEVERQYILARKNAASTAANIARAGFTVVIDDIIHQAWLQEWRDNLRGFDLRLVLLQPHLDTAKQRNTTREIWTVDEAIIEQLHSSFSANNTPDVGWTIVDNTNQTIEETVAEILSEFSLVP